MIVEIPFNSSVKYEFDKEQTKCVVIDYQLLCYIL